MNYLPALWSVYNGSQVSRIREDLPSNQEILDGVGDLLFNALFGLGRQAVNMSFGGGVVSSSINIHDDTHAKEKVALFLQTQGVLTSMALDDMSSKFKTWYNDTFKTNTTQAVKNAIESADPNAETISINIDPALWSAMAGVASLYANNAIESVIHSGGGSFGTLSWSDSAECKSDCTGEFRLHGLITNATECYNQSFPIAMERDGSMVNIFFIENKINGKIIPCMKNIYPSVVGEPILFDGFQLRLQEDSGSVTFAVYANVNEESIGKQGNNMEFRRSTRTYGEVTLNPYIVKPYNVMEIQDGSSTYTVQLFDSMVTNTQTYSSSEESIWSNVVAGASDFYSGMTAEQKVDPASYSLKTMVRNNIRYNEVEDFPVIIDPNVAQSLIGDTYDAITSGNGATVTDRTGEGRTAVLSPTSIGILNGADVVTGDLVDALPTAINVYPADTVTEETIGTISIPIADAIEAIDQANEASGASEGIALNPLVSDTGDYGLFTLYKMTHAQLKTLSSKLWSSSFVDNIHPFKNDPSEALISLMAYPIDIESAQSDSAVICGNLNCSPASGKIVSKLFQTKSLGSIKIPERFNNYMDYSPYTKISMYLPFIGFVKLDPDEVMGATLTLEYRVELLTGTCVATIKVVKGTLNAILYQFSGNMGVTLPLSASSFGRVYSNLIGSALSLGGAIGGAIATGGALTPLVAGAVANVASNVEATKPDITKSGGMGGNSGMCGNMSAYVIIDYVVPDTPDGYNTFKGKPTNKYLEVGSLTGFVQLDSYHLDIPNITDDERVELDGLLTNGIIV